MKKTILLTVSILSLMSIVHATEDGPKRAPGMVDEHAPKDHPEKKKDIVLNEDVKCVGGKSLPIIEAATTVSMKDSSKVAKIILTEDELVKMKKEIKEEVKKEMMKEMADKPEKSRGERPNKKDERDEEERPKMAEGKGKRQMPGGRGGNESQGFSFSSQMAAQMGGSQMMGQPQMNMNQMGSANSRDQMMQNQIRVPQMNFNRPYQNNFGNNQMRRPPMMQQNQNAYNGYQPYVYQSNPGQNYGAMNVQSNYNFMAPQMDYGYTTNSSMMPNVYTGQNNIQVTPSYSQYSFTGF